MGPTATIAAKTLLGANLAELGAIVEKWGEPAYRARQLFEWLYRKHVARFAEMSNLPAPLRERLAAEFIEPGQTLSLAVRQESTDGTIKYLFRLPDGAEVESVMIPDGNRRTACISSQVGCAMGCTFCATAIGGLERNLQTGEITAQVLAINHDLAGQGLGPLTNVVFMGMGEPLANYARVVAAIRLINEGIGIGQRHITVSTSGLAPQIRKLADEGLQITLALSLHQVTDAEREVTMPITKRYTIAELMEACHDYVRLTGRRVSFEYALMAGENDSPRHAQTLADLAAPLGAHVNLIPLNPVRGAQHQRPTDAAVARFRNLLDAEGVTASVRRSRGLDIDAACGQLRQRALRGERGEPAVPLGGDPAECPS